MALTRFTLRQIEAFLLVADLHSFTEAGNRLGLTAQAVSQLVAVRNKSAGVVRIGAPLVLACTAVPAAIRAYRRSRPRVAVRVRDIPVDNLVDSVAAGDVDLAIGHDRAVGAEVSSQPLFDSVWCSPEHPLARRRSIQWSDLHDHPLVAAGYDHERSVAQMRLSVPEDMRITPVDVVDNITTALGIAAQNEAATLAPAYVGVLANQLGLVMRRVLRPETVRKVCLYKPVARAASPASEGFAEHLQQWMPSWPDSIGRQARTPRARKRSD